MRDSVNWGLGLDKVQAIWRNCVILCHWIVEQTLHCRVTHETVGTQVTLGIWAWGLDTEDFSKPQGLADYSLLAKSGSQSLFVHKAFSRHITPICLFVVNIYFCYKGTAQWLLQSVYSPPSPKTFIMWPLTGNIFLLNCYIILRSVVGIGGFQGLEREKWSELPWVKPLCGYIDIQGKKLRLPMGGI